MSFEVNSYIDSKIICCCKQASATSKRRDHFTDFQRANSKDSYAPSNELWVHEEPEYWTCLRIPASSISCIRIVSCGLDSVNAFILSSSASVGLLGWGPSMRSEAPAQDFKNHQWCWCSVWAWSSLNFIQPFSTLMCILLLTEVKW